MMGRVHMLIFCKPMLLAGVRRIALLVAGRRVQQCVPKASRMCRGVSLSAMVGCNDACKSATAPRAVRMLRGVSETQKEFRLVTWHLMRCVCLRSLVCSLALSRHLQWHGATWLPGPKLLAGGPKWRSGCMQVFCEPKLLAASSLWVVFRQLRQGSVCRMASSAFLRCSQGT